MLQCPIDKSNLALGHPKAETRFGPLLAVKVA
jgi:hypothetical protein